VRRNRASLSKHAWSRIAPGSVRAAALEVRDVKAEPEPVDSVVRKREIRRQLPARPCEEGCAVLGQDYSLLHRDAHSLQLVAEVGEGES
jgi:hypothetical protein